MPLHSPAAGAGRCPPGRLPRSAQLDGQQPTAAAALRSRGDWPTKVCCAAGPSSSRARARAPSGSARGPAPARRERLRGHGPAPAAAPAQMPRRSWRVGTCPGAGAGAATASPPPSRRSLSRAPRVHRAAGPSPPGAAGSPRAVVSRAPLRRKSAGGGPRRPRPRAGALHGVRWAEGRAVRGRAAGTGGAAHARVAREQRRSAPSLPARGRGPARGGVRSAARESESCSRASGPCNFAAGGATRSCAGRSQ